MLSISPMTRSLSSRLSSFFAMRMSTPTSARFCLRSGMFMCGGTTASSMRGCLSTTSTLCGCGMMFMSVFTLITSMIMLSGMFMCGVTPCSTSSSCVLSGLSTWRTTFMCIMRMIITSVTGFTSLSVIIGGFIGKMPNLISSPCSS